ncbi:TIGR00282 family metallophosphoesterase [Oleidesulfovibrio sp.]|uniref:TIGR00282 family metallophosphoesterase n=1 Tax=Oleidesulfovibrio sp. TaxID=2909707 RepID=UPI003A8608BD
MRILMLGDVVGKPGRIALREHLPALRAERRIDFVVANGENASGGIGLTGEGFTAIRASGADVVTSGNHIWKHKEIYNVLNREDRLVRPANYPAGAPGKGMTVAETASGHKVAVINLLGRTFMDPVDCPFQSVDTLLASVPQDATVRLVDFHAETTSEKKSMGWYLDGRVSVMAGTHTHVQTNDAQILPQGTAYLTDLGMCGVEASVLGMDYNCILERMVTRLPRRFVPAKGRGGINGLLVELDDATAKAVHVEIIRIEP